MNIIGIDISKAWFDCYCSRRRAHKQFDNSLTGWRQFTEWVAEDALQVVMEASGPYYLELASWLHDQGMVVSVINPLVIRRYGQMRLSRTKTDAKDATLIAQYGRDQQPEPWQPPSAVCQALRQQSILMGQQEAFGGNREADPLVGEVLAAQREQLRLSLARIDQRLQQIVELHYSKGLQALLTIPGIGPKTAILLVAITDGFIRFESARTLASYVGICPRIWESGSSIKGRGAICKLGCPQLRKLLYMCSWTAKNCNPGCAQMYRRLKEKGKPEKVIKVAIAHKLLRQAFAVGKKQQPFNEKLVMAA